MMHPGTHRQSSDRRLPILLAAACAVAAIALNGQERPVNPGDPLPGLSALEFCAGRDDFLEVETAEDGLGPAYNATSCAVCHSVPAVGGGGVMLEMRAAYRDGADVYRGLNDAGDTLMHMFSTPGHTCQPVMPDDANVVARRAPIPLFGAGLVEAIPDETILALEDPEDRDGDGISGRAARIFDLAGNRERIGRFGWKAQQATLLAFSGDAYRDR